MHGKVWDEFRDLDLLVKTKARYEKNIATIRKLIIKDSKREQEEVKEFLIYLMDWYTDEFMEELRKLKREFRVYKQDAVSAVGFNLDFTNKHISAIQRILKARSKHIKTSYYPTAFDMQESVKEQLHYEKLYDLFIYQLHPYLNYYPIMLFLASCVITLAISSIYHIFKSMSQSMNSFFLRLDYAGINVLILGSSFVCYYYVFICQISLYNLYSTALVCSCSLVFMKSLKKPNHNRKQFNQLYFLFLGLSNLIPYFHALYLSCQANTDNDYIPPNLAFIGILVSASCFAVGFKIYTLRFPEKQFPYRFDIWLNSHVIWHLFVNLGIVVQIYTVFYIHQLRLQYACYLCN